MKYYVIWHNWDGGYTEEFDTQDAAEARINEIYRMVALSRNGEVFDMCIKGERMRLDAREVSIVYLLNNFTALTT